MLNVGDKVVYMAISNCRYKKYKIYTIENVCKNSYDDKYIYTINRMETYINNFITLKEYRKLKIEKLKISII